MRQGRFRSLADLAFAYGYADQAHFTRDVSQFADEPPLQLLARMLPEGTGVMARVG